MADTLKPRLRAAPVTLPSASRASNAVSKLKSAFCIGTAYFLNCVSCNYSLYELRLVHTATDAHTHVMQTILLIAASRGLGLAMAGEFLKKDWNVVGTVRGTARTGLHDLADRHPGRLEIESLEICDQAQVKALRQRLAGRAFEMLFVNAGTTNNEKETIAQVSVEEFIRVMTTNASCPMRVVESLQDLVTADGLIGVMSSGQGSVTNNVNGMREVYRGSKAALNQFMRSFAARQSKTKRALALMAPGWIRTDLGGPEARLTIDESIPNLVNVLLDKQGKPGLEYLDYLGRTVPW
jgi:NAD(P)-dependent dehydrogenase (short-subunit alcohol dehydrogenase family)